MKKNLHIVIVSVIFAFLLWGSISLSRDYYVTINVPIKIINFTDGFTSGTKLPSKVSIKIRGNGWKLVAVNLGAESEFLVSASGDTGRKYINLYNYLSDNHWLSSDMEVLDISPDTLTIFIERKIEKKLKIKPEFDLGFKPGYGLASDITIFPESTTVIGPASVLRNSDNIPTQKFELSNLDRKVVEQVRLKSIQGMSYSANIVTVNLDVQKIVDKGLENIHVNILDAPRDREVVLLPNRISIGIRGGINILGKISEDKLNAFVYYRDVVLDTLGSVAPHIDLPDNTSLIYTRPDRLRYIIKKFN